MADIERWITINGAHIPIIKGESRARAVANFIKSKRNAKVKSTQKRLLNEAIKPDYRNDKVAKEITKNAAKMIERSNRPTIKGRAKTRDEIEDERFDRYDEAAHNAARNLRFDNRAKPLSQDELYDRAHEIAKASSMYDMDYKYGKGGTHENKQVKIGDNIESARYKLKVDKETPAKRTIKDVMTDKMRRAEKAEKPYKEKAKKYNSQGYALEEKLNREPRNTAASDNRYYNLLDKQTDAFRKEHHARQRGYEAYQKVMDSKRSKKYTMTDANRRKMINDIGSKVTKLDRQVENAKTTPEFRRLQKKEEKAQKVINALGGKYIVGRRKK